VDTRSRSANHERRNEDPHSLQDGHLLGGDFVLNKDGEASTLSFCFEYGGENYGLTVGHRCEKVGDPVFAFYSSEPTPPNDYDVDGESYELCEIGAVVSLTKKTDSLVSSIHERFPVSSL
jgi:hypothetical protein